MYSKNLFAVSGALLSVVAAVPMAKRDVVWVTKTHEDVVTMPVTTTVWINPGETAPAVGHHYGHHGHSKITSHIQSTVTVSAVPSSAPETSAESSYVAPSSYEAPSSSSVYVPPPPSSTYVAPTTSSTSIYVAPTPSSTYIAPSTTSAAPAATSSAASSGSGSGLSSGMGASGTSYTGDLTWYQDGMGACGWNSGPSDHIVAISEDIFDSYSDAGNPNNNPLCGKTVSITGADGSSYTAKIVDRCTGCAAADLDLSQDFFNTVTNNGDGRVHGMSWKFD